MSQAQRLIGAACEIHDTWMQLAATTPSNAHLFSPFEDLDFYEKDKDVQIAEQALPLHCIYHSIDKASLARW